MNDTLILPGIGGSGPDHWQTLWEGQSPGLRRFRPADWNQPDLGDWMEALDSAVAACTAPPLLVAHSLACLLVAHWQARSTRPVRGAFLVAVPDPRSKAFPPEAAGFADPPAGRLRFPSLIVASSDDPYGSSAYVAARAGDWGSGLVELGAYGHINGRSGLGSWQEGRRLLAAFAAGTGVGAGA